MFDGQMAYDHSGAQPVYAPNSEGRGWADGEETPEESWAVDGEMVRSAYELHADDDDFSQQGALVRDGRPDRQRERLVAPVRGRPLGGVQREAISRASRRGGDGKE